MVLSDVGGCSASEGYYDIHTGHHVPGAGDVNLPKGEIVWLLLAAGIALAGTITFSVILAVNKGGASTAAWLAAVYGVLAVLTVAALVIAGIQSKKKLVGEGYITAVQEARVFDLWAFFHYLVPAMIGTGIAALLTLAHSLSGSAIYAISVGSTIAVATLWELVERPLIHAGYGEYPSNIVGDVVIGTVGAAVSVSAFLLAMGKKIPAGVIVPVGAGFAGAGLLITSGSIWYGAITPHTGIDTWPDHRMPIAPDPMFRNIA
jgi:hypothetical protein